MKTIYKIISIFLLLLLLAIFNQGYLIATDYPYYGFLMSLKYAGIRFDDPQNSADSDYGVLEFYQNLETPTENQDIFALNFDANTTTDVQKTIVQFYTQAYNMDDASAYGGQIDISVADRGNSGTVEDFISCIGDATTHNPTHNGAVVINDEAKDINFIVESDAGNWLIKTDASGDSVALREKVVIEDSVQIGGGCWLTILDVDTTRFTSTDQADTIVYSGMTANGIVHPYPYGSSISANDVLSADVKEDTIFVYRPTSGTSALTYRVEIWKK